MHFDLFSSSEQATDTERECRDRMRRFQVRFGRHVTPELSVFINNGWRRLAEAGDWDRVNLWIDKLYELAIARFPCED